MLIQSSVELGETSGPSSSSLPLQVKKLRPQSSCFLRKPQHSRALVCFSRPSCTSFSCRSLAGSPLSNVPDEAFYLRGMSTVPQALSLDPDCPAICQQVIRL